MPNPEKRFSNVRCHNAAWALKTHSEKKEHGEVRHIIDKKQTVILLSAVVMAAMLGSIALTGYASSNSSSSIGNNQSTSTQNLLASELFGRGQGGGPGRGGCNGLIEVSAEYNQTVINIANSDQDVQNLLNDGTPFPQSDQSSRQ